jgi:c-di-GMP-binding flagellar brake protein YcgR
MIFPMFPLAVDFTVFWKEDTTPLEAIIFFTVLAAIVAFFIFLGRNREKILVATEAAAASSGGSGFGLSSRFKLRRLAKNAGLSREQKKMLAYAFKIDHVTDPEKSINTPTLLDRHFKQAYREIEQSDNSTQEIQNRLSVLFSTRNLLENAGGNLTSTVQLKDDAVLTINNGKDKYNVPVVSIKEEHLEVACPKNALGSPIKFQKGGKITALFFTKNNKGFSFETRILGDSSSLGKSTLLLAHSNQLKFLSQRRYRRKQSAINCNLFNVIVEGSGKKQRLIVDKRRLMGNIADISVGGCSIKTKTPVQVGAKLKIEFTQGGANVAALGQVLRTNRAGIDTVIHIKFLKVTRKSMNIINAFVYEYAY